jgi:putative oxidoreductase
MFGLIPMSFAPVLQSALRLVAAFSFITHGTQKLFAVPLSQPGNPVELLTRMGTAGMLETFGGLLMFVGLFSRPVAFVLAGEMAVVYFQFHSPQGIWPILNGGELASLYCFIWLYFASIGPGPISIDAIFSKDRDRRGYR